MKKLNIFAQEHIKTAIIIANIISIFCLVICVINIFIPYSAHAQKVQITKIVDGDTIEVRENTKVYKVRFACSDTPETHKGYQMFNGHAIGHLATQHLKEKIRLNDTVDLKCHTHDRYGRKVCVIYKHHRDINHEMIYDGFADAPSKYCDSHYVYALEDAKKYKRGLWSYGKWESPSHFRHNI